jgi:toxin HigB-1
MRYNREYIHDPEPLIKSFADAETERIFRRQPSRKIPPNVQRRALRKLVMLHAAADLSDLRPPKTTPATRLEALKGDRAGQHSLRINDQWRLCFTWRDGDAYDVGIVDYH